jgi:hypothetical protein
MVNWRKQLGKEMSILKPISHRQLAYAIPTWLSNRTTSRGIKGDVEVAIDDGYVADYFGLCSFQNRYYSDYCKFWDVPVVKESVGMGDTFKHYDLVNYFACVFEVKVSRYDFLKTFNNSARHANRHVPIGHLHWCVILKDIIKPDDLPSFWGLLEWTGQGLREKKKPVLCDVSNSTLDSLAHKLLWTIGTSKKYATLLKEVEQLREGVKS